MKTGILAPNLDLDDRHMDIRRKKNDIVSEFS